MRDILWLYFEYCWANIRIKFLKGYLLNPFQFFKYVLSLDMHCLLFELDLKLSINECLLMHAYKHNGKCIYFIPPPCPLIMNMHVYYILKIFHFALDYNVHV